MRIARAAEILKAVYSHDAPRCVYLEGAPGVGKSDLVRHVADELGFKLIDVRAALLDPVDLRGIPYMDGGMTRWATPEFLPPSDSEDKWLLFTDELAQATTLVQNAFLQLFRDRQLGDWVAPPGMRFIAAGNRVSDRAGAHRLTTALSSRFACKLEIEPNLEDFQDWALQNNIDGRVRSFLNFRPEMLFQFEPSEDHFPNPRAWHYVSDLMQSVPEAYLLEVATGAVGQGAAAELVSHVKLHDKLPDYQEVLSQPETYSIPEEPSVCWALCGRLVESIKEDVNNLEPAAKYITRCPAEIQATYFRDFFKLHPSESLGSSTISKWLRDNSEVLATI